MSSRAPQPCRALTSVGDPGGCQKTPRMLAPRAKSVLISVSQFWGSLQTGSVSTPVENSPFRRADNSGNLCLRSLEFFGHAMGLTARGRRCRQSFGRKGLFFTSSGPPVGPFQSGRALALGHGLGPATRREIPRIVAPIPVKLSMPETRRVFASGPKRFPSTPPLKCYSSCYSLIRVLGTFRVG